MAAHQTVNLASFGIPVSSILTLSTAVGEGRTFTAGL